MLRIVEVAKARCCEVANRMQNVAEVANRMRNVAEVANRM